MTSLRENGKTLSLEIEGKIKEILISELEIRPGTLTSVDSTTPLLGRGIGLDSVEALRLVAGVERAFDIQIDDADLTVELFRNIGTFAEYVLKKIVDRKTVL